ncbi:MAG: hypothetical protein UX28_C0001G0042 [Candidatus Pacebacteria bacterium GW2011_GWA1_46_10]|nr:MAG: hypothetical protein UX28_C0001G0042 [Candidatus Pacebacteria bacterium GW2011_GWA1_46_10]HCR80976.1 hypothetical protein [Candidatus Paceibacterota bacterium]
MKKIIALIAIIGAATAVYVYAQGNNISLAEEVASLPKEAVQDLQQTARESLGGLAEKAKELGTETKKVLGESVQVDESEPSFQQKAVEYGQYLYCKQVVESYERK